MTERNYYFISNKETVLATRQVFIFLSCKKCSVLSLAIVHLGQTVSPAENTDAVRSVVYVTDFKNVIEKVDKLQRLVKLGVMDGDLIKYLPDMAELVYQSMIYNIRMRKVPALSDMETICKSYLQVTRQISIDTRTLC